MEKQVFANLFWWSARCGALGGFGRVEYKRAISPSNLMGRLLVKRLCGPLEFLFQLLDVGCLFHVHFVAVLVIEMILKIGQLLVGDNSYSQSVLHLPFTVE